MVTSNRLKKAVREHMKAHGTSYREALAAVTSGSTDMERSPGPAADLRAQWAARQQSENLGADIGARSDGTDYTIAFGPETPAVVSFTGAAGSGKSNLLDSTVTSLAYQYGPDRVRFILAARDSPAPTAAREFCHPEFGERTFRVTDDGDVSQLSRVVQGEIDSRLRLLNLVDAVTVSDIRKAGKAFPVLVPELVVVVDDYSDDARDQLVELVTTIGMVGRSMGVRCLVGGGSRRSPWLSNSHMLLLDRTDDTYSGAAETNEADRFTPHHAHGPALRARRAATARAVAPEEV